MQNDTKRNQKYLKEISGTERNGNYGNHDKFFDKEQIMKLSIKCGRHDADKEKGCRTKQNICKI